MSTLREPRFTRSFSRQRHVQDDEDAPPKGPLNVDKIAVIGGGNMAEAIITGLLSEQLIESEKIVVSDPNPDIRQKYKDQNIGTSDRNGAAVRGADVVVIAVKPQVLNEVMESFRGELKPDALVLSVVAGATIGNMQDILGDHAHIIRTMPNTPAMIGEGMTVWSQSSEVTEHQHTLTRSILGAFGVEVFVDDEGALDMATALSGTGPAYFFLVAEAMIDTGVHMGFSRAVATKLVQQTMLGSALYMQSSNVHPVMLRNNITSPGGTTAAALYRAEKNGFRAVIADSIWAAASKRDASSSRRSHSPSRERGGDRERKGRDRADSRDDRRRDRDRGGSRKSRSRSRSASRGRNRSRSRSRSRSRGRDRDRDRGGRDRDRGRDRGGRDRGRDRSRSRDRGRGRDRMPISLLVRNLDTSTTVDDLRRAFTRKSGDIRDVYIPKEFASNLPRGFAFIEWVMTHMATARQIKREMDRTKLNGREIAPDKPYLMRSTLFSDSRDDGESKTRGKENSPMQS
ncbi:hypothetical protein P43SY_005152 [Pythium insidiosum]|uniref:Pyrroline-5-carboxylate reductase n=1 Tax=Pythium insidiosum TaxID=114742 RepID=A0AAD5L9H0_PYTIN|nr:hypothetical protein P43SY_005152 [Pythium insidiosum]